jgi:hypothetical protein
MDFVEGFPKVGGKLVILTVVDRFSKYVHFIALGHPYSAASVAKAFFEGIVHLHSLSCSIVSGRDVLFTSGFWAELFRLSGVKLNMSSTFHPQSDGQSEVVNWVILMYLHCLAVVSPSFFSLLFHLSFISVFLLLWVSSLAYPNSLGTKRHGCFFK